MKRTKKFVALLLGVLFLVSLTACAQTPAPAASDESETVSEAPAPAESASSDEQESASSGEKVKITYAQWGNADETAATQKVAETFNASQDRIEVEVLQIPWENYITELNTMATAGNLPDTAIMQEKAVLKWAEQGLLADVSGMYEGAESKPLDCITYKADGKPVAYSSANEILLMYYNKDMFDAAGVAYPPDSIDTAWTWDEFVATAKKLTLDKNGKHPDEAGFDSDNIVQYGCMVENLTWQLEAYCLSNGGGFFSEDGSKVMINDPASIEAIQKIADLYLVDHVAPLSNGASDDGVQRSLIAGTCAMTTNGAWNVGTCLGAAREEGLNYGVAVLPYMQKPITIATGGSNVVFNTSKHPAEAMEWIKWYYQEENSWSLIEEGTWMPILEKWYTDEELTRKWVENPNFPEYDQYKSAVVDTAINNDVTKPCCWFYVNNTTDFLDVLTSALGPVWTGETTAEEAINSSIDALTAAFEGNA